ncbi:MAG: hypothetical protein GY842_27805 [bacterium]|nr:hypothetical protein [bacterium]
MAYKSWRSAFAARFPGEPDCASEARLWNLENDRRIRKRIGILKQKLGRQHGKLCSSGSAGSPDDDAAHVLDEVLEETRAKPVKWLRLLPVPSSAPPPPEVFTFVSAEELAKYHPDVFLDPESGQRTVQLPKPIKARPEGLGFVAATPFLWVTFEENGLRPPLDDPTAVRCELGLPHFRADEYVYRVPLTVRPGQDSFVPSAIDANAGPPWKPADPGAMRGVTRDLTTGEDRWPELLVETRDYLSVHPRVELVSPAGPAVKAQSVPVDYMVGRV